MKIRHSEDHRALRARAYPTIGEQLDAVYKLAVALKEQGFSLPDETERWLEKCAEVKRKFKKRVG